MTSLFLSSQSFYHPLSDPVNPAKPVCSRGKHNNKMCKTILFLVYSPPCLYHIVYPLLLYCSSPPSFLSSSLPPLPSLLSPPYPLSPPPPSSPQATLEHVSSAQGWTVLFTSLLRQATTLDQLQVLECLLETWAEDSRCGFVTWKD